MRILRALLLAALIPVVSCDGGRGQGVTVAGSTSVQPFAEMVAEEFMAEHPGGEVLVQGGGSTAGIQAVREGAAEIGTVSRELRGPEQDLYSIVMARDGIAVIVHPSNAIDSLTREQIRAIFVGEVTDFSDVGGAKGPVRPVTREEGSGTRGAFQELVMEGQGITPEALVQDSNGSMRELIASDPGGIGYISLGLVNGSVKALEIDGVKASHENARTGRYRYVRPFLFVLKAEPSGRAKEFIDYVLSERGQGLLEAEGLIPARQAGVPG